MSKQWMKLGEEILSIGCESGKIPIRRNCVREGK